MTLTYIFLMNDRNVDGYGKVNEEEEEALFKSKSRQVPREFSKHSFEPFELAKRREFNDCISFEV